MRWMGGLCLLFGLALLACDDEYGGHGGRGGSSGTDGGTADGSAGTGGTGGTGGGSSAGGTGGGSGAGGSGSSGGSSNSVMCNGGAWTMGPNCQAVYDRVVACCVDAVVAKQQGDQTVCDLLVNETKCDTDGSSASEAACASLGDRSECK